MEVIYSLDEIGTTARKFWKTVADRKVFAFHGPLGAGKTTFISKLCQMKKVKDEPSSPTFSLINDYLYEVEGQEKHLYHLDLYRIHDEEEAIQAGIEDTLLSGAICFVEWAEKIPDLLPGNTVHVWISLERGGKRRMKIQLEENLLQF